MAIKLLLFLLFIFPSIAVGAINSGNITGATLSLSGTGFGTKSTAAPIQWDNFEAGTNGSAVSTSPPVGSWVVDPGVTYTSAVNKPGSTLSARHDFTTGTNYRQALQRAGGPWGKLYISFWYRTDYGNLTADYDDPCRNYKVFRMEGDNGTKTGDQGEGVPLISYEKRASSSSGGLYEEALRADYNVPEGSGTFYGGQHPVPPLDWSHQEWHRVEMYVNVIDGQKDFRLWEDAQDNSPAKIYASWTTTFEPLMGSDNSRFDQLNFGIYFARDNGASAYTYTDNIYVDTTMQRVELGNASTWAASTIREVQPATAWSDTGITASLNMGSLTGLTDIWVYVVGDNGEPISTTGYHLVGDGDPPLICLPDPDGDLYPSVGGGAYAACPENYYVESHFVSLAYDCDDSSAAINPGAMEICGDSIDQDCSGADLACAVAGGTRVGAGTTKVSANASQATLQ